MAKLKVPKRVAGVKVPKKLRKEAKRALNLTDSPAVRDLALAGLTLAAENLLDRNKAKQTVDAARDVARQASEVTKASLKALDLGDILRAAAVEGARRFLESFEEAQRGRRASARPARAEAAAKQATPRSGAAAAKGKATSGKDAAKPPRAAASRKPAAKTPAASDNRKAGAAPRRRPSARRGGVAAE